MLDQMRNQHTMLKKTFNSKTAADDSGQIYPPGDFSSFTNSEEPDSEEPDPFFLQAPSSKILEGYAEIYGVHPDDVDLSGIKPTDIIHTNNIDTILRRNRHEESEEEFGKPDFTRPIAPLYLPTSGTDLSSLMPALSDEEHDRRHTMEYARSQPIVNSNHAATKALTLAMNIAPTLTDHAHDECKGSGLVDKNGNPMPCAGCEGRGHTIFDTTGHTGMAGLKHSAGAWNAALHAHNFYCTGPSCFAGCAVEPHVRHIREDLTERGHTVKDHHIKYQHGRYGEASGYGEALRRILAPIVVEDRWEPTAPGIRAHSTHTNLEGALTHNIRPGDLVSVHGVGIDPGATMLVHSVNSDGSLNGHYHAISFASADAEIQDRRDRSRGVDVNGKPGLSLELMHSDPKNSFSSIATSPEDQDLSNSLVDTFGKRLSTAAGANRRASAVHITTVDRKPTEMRWVENIGGDRVSKLNPIIEPHLQFRGHIYQTAPYGDILDHRGNRMLQRTGKPYADSTYAKSERVVKFYRGANPWSLSNLHEAFHNMKDADSKNKLMETLSSMNRRNGVPSSSINSDAPQYDHPLNLVPQTQNIGTVLVRSNSTFILPSNVKQLNAERASSELNSTLKNLGIKTDREAKEPADASSVSEKLLSPEHEDYLRQVLTSRMDRALKPGEFETFKDVFARTKDLEKAHQAIDPSAIGHGDDIWDEE